jgi:hypothetical protein
MLAASVAAMPSPSSHRAKAGNARLAPRAVEHHHRARIDQAVDGERNQPRHPARLTVRPHELVRVLI